MQPCQRVRRHDVKKGVSAGVVASCPSPREWPRTPHHDVSLVRNTANVTFQTRYHRDAHASRRTDQQAGVCQWCGRCRGSVRRFRCLWRRNARWLTCPYLRMECWRCLAACLPGHPPVLSVSGCSGLNTPPMATIGSALWALAARASLGRQRSTGNRQSAEAIPSVCPSAIRSFVFI